jgi:hypothetical protein
MSLKLREEIVLGFDEPENRLRCQVRTGSGVALTFWPTPQTLA